MRICVSHTFSESRRHTMHIVVYLRGHPYDKLLFLCQKRFEDTEVNLSVAVDYVLHHDFLPTSLTKAV